MNTHLDRSNSTRNQSAPESTKPKRYVKPWTKVIGSAVFEIYDYKSNADEHSAGGKSNGFVSKEEVNNKDQSNKSPGRSCRENHVLGSYTHYNVDVENDWRNANLHRNGTQPDGPSNGNHGYQDITGCYPVANRRDSGDKSSNKSSEAVSTGEEQSGVDRSGFRLDAAVRVKQESIDSEILPHQQRGFGANCAIDGDNGDTCKTCAVEPNMASPSTGDRTQEENSDSCLTRHRNERAFIPENDYCKITPIKKWSTSSAMSLSADNGQEDHFSSGAIKVERTEKGSPTGKGPEMAFLPPTPTSLPSDGDESQSEGETKSPNLLAPSGMSHRVLGSPSGHPSSRDHNSPTSSSNGCGISAPRTLGLTLSPPALLDPQSPGGRVSPGRLSPGGLSPGGLSPSEDRWWRVPPKKRWLPQTPDYHGQVLVTDVTYRDVTVTFMESSTDKGFFKNAA